MGGFTDEYLFFFMFMFDLDVDVIELIRIVESLEYGIIGISNYWVNRTIKLSNYWAYSNLHIFVLDFVHWIPKTEYRIPNNLWNMAHTLRITNDSWNAAHTLLLDFCVLNTEYSTLQY